MEMVGMATVVMVTSSAARNTAEHSAATMSAVCSFVRWSSGSGPEAGAADFGS